MPWCEDCSKYWAPTALTTDGTCPTCGRVVGDHERDDGDDDSDHDGDDPSDESTPWHFKLLIVLLVVYLGWRFVQLLT